jgi:hypothetical protein
VSNQPERPEPARESRRSFLAKLGIGVAALAAITLPFSRLARGKGEPRQIGAQAFPGEDSMFHPASDPRLDPRRPRL